MQDINWQEIWSVIGYDEARPLLFNSADFFFLFIAFFGVYVLLRNRQNLRILYTLGFSLYFYYLSSGFFFFLLIFSTIADFILGHFIYNAGNKRKSRFYLILSILINLGLLGYFKYTNFLIGAVNDLMSLDLSFKNIFLPVGISFYTFQTMSYSIDIYRKKLVPLTEDVHDLKSLFLRLNDFAFFVSFFPQLVAGPIVRAADFIPQIRKKPVLEKEQLGIALMLITGGLFKKAVISDYISVNFVDRVFENPALYTGFENLMAVYGYSIQIYCDFSGYSDMAIGLALVLGFQLPENFRKPYQAHSVRNFWQRWHISLSTWLRDYLYISLGGNRKGSWRTYGNLMLTMLLGGLWHGAGWVFVIWGGLHGFALAADRLMDGAKKVFSNPALKALLILLSVHLIGQIVLFVKFAAESPEIYQTYTNGNLTASGVWIVLFLIAFGIAKLVRNQKVVEKIHHIAAGIYVFHFVALAWIFFRAGAINNPEAPMVTTNKVLGQILGFFKLSLVTDIIYGYPKVFGLIILGFILHFLPISFDKKVTRVYSNAPLVVQILVFTLVVWIAIQATGSDVVPFIYFQF